MIYFVLNNYLGMYIFCKSYFYFHNRIKTQRKTYKLIFKETKMKQTQLTVISFVKHASK